MTTYHYTTGIPPQFAQPRPWQVLRYTAHARAEAARDGVQLSLHYLPPAFTLVETVVADAALVNRWLVRVPCYARRNGEWWDLVISLTPAGDVLTVWLNRASDTHATLRHDRIRRTTV